MTLFLNCQSLKKSFGSRLLFSDLSFSIFSGDRIGLIGPNGAGKSTLLKLIAKIDSADSGTIAYKRDLKIGYLPQFCEFPDQHPTELLLHSLQQDQRSEYEKTHLVETWLSKLGFKGNESSASQLSGGWKKRLKLAQELMQEPDLLLLDEPTNHLDLESILWLEKFLLRECPSFLLVSHDRSFLQQMSNRILEVNPIYPSGLFALEGTYAHFLEKKEEFIRGQLEQERSLASKARHELDWLRRSPKARTTKSQARVDDAHELLQELAQIKRRNRPKKPTIDFSATERETKKLLVAHNLGKSIGDKPLFRHLSFTLSPGTRLGLLGPNGSGKTTLMRMLAGELTPDQGNIKVADELKIVYFDQHRLQIPLDTTLRKALSPHGDFVNFRGEAIHVNGWCQRFLFSPDVLDMPLHKLSGGERARISIAHLMLQPADLLLLDEPTNDLDIPTMETFEENLLEFPGAVVLITHDRFLLDRICTSLIGLGYTENTQIFSDYAQWEKQLTQVSSPSKEKEKSIQRSSPRKTTLSYSEKKEYEQIESLILKQEETIQTLNHLLETTNSSDHPTLQRLCSEISLAETEIARLYLRWEELEKKQSG